MMAPTMMAVLVLVVFQGIVPLFTASWALLRCLLFGSVQVVVLLW